MLKLTAYSVENIVESMNSKQFTVQANDWLSAETKTRIGRTVISMKLMTKTI